MTAFTTTDGAVTLDFTTTTSVLATTIITTRMSKNLSNLSSLTYKQAKPQW